LIKKIISIAAGALWWCTAPTTVIAQSGADSLLHFIEQNRSRASLYLQQNDSAVARLNETRMMPLASTVKIIVAIEFAKQAAYHLIDENQKIPLADLDRYYIPHTDGEAHPSWLRYEKRLGNIKGDSISLLEVARGMILFSSNANTEYLTGLLGTANINSNIKLLGVLQHTPVYPLVSSLFLYQNPKHIKEDKIIKQIGKFSDLQYAKATWLIHEQLAHDSGYKNRFRLQDLTVNMQKEWSDRLPSSDTRDYVRICHIINNRKIFDSTTYGILSSILESLMLNPANQSWLVHAGEKGGSTMFVLTKAVYATLKDGTRIEMAYFFNDLSQEENLRLQKWMNDFELKILRDENFRKETASALE
jgi:D-alanyl-D-alanine carboxypeptidase